MEYVFISYAKEDSEFAMSLSNQLQQAGVLTWLDRLNISVGENWQTEITNALMRANTVLYIASKNSVSSNYALNELNRALEAKLKVIPVIIDEQGSREMPKLLYGKQWIDFSTNSEAALQRLIAILPNLLVQRRSLTIEKPKSKGYVFISYAEEDTGFAQQLRQFFKERDYAYWDYQESNRNYQTIIRKELEDALRNASAVVFILSPDWKKAEWTHDEYDFAISLKIPVFRLMIRHMEATFGVTTRLWIDFIKDQKEGFTKLDNELRRAGLI